METRMEGRKCTDRQTGRQMEVSDYSPTRRWFPVWAVVWWQPNGRQIRWARLPLNKAFSVDTALSIWLIYSAYSIMFKFCHALKRRLGRSATGRETDRPSIFGYISNVFSGAERWRSFCCSSDFVTLKNPSGLWLQCNSMSVITCNSVWGLSPDGSAGTTSTSPPLPPGDFLWPCKCWTQQKTHWMQRAEIHGCVCVWERREVTGREHRGNSAYLN